MSARTYKYSRPKAGSTAIPFLVTVLISLVVFGGAAFYFYQMMMQKRKELPIMPSAINSITDEDINSILFVLEPDDPTHQTAIMMLHFDPVRKQEFCLGIPLDLVIENEGRSMTVAACLTNHGAGPLKSALAKALDQEIDRYVLLNSRTFKTLVELIGNVSYAVPVKDTGLRKSNAAILLDASQFETMLTSSKYPKEAERYPVIGISVAQLLNQCDGERIGKNLESYFNQVINVVETDITSMDFQNHKHAISYMFENVHVEGKSPARGVEVMVDETPDGLLVLKENFNERLKVTFNQLSNTGANKQTETAE